MTDSPLGEPRLPERFAAVDLGSNSFHMVIAELRRGHINFVDRRKDVVRLAAGLDTRGYLTEEAIERAHVSLRQFGERLGHMPAHAVRIVGTNTLRRARNSRTVLELAADALHHDVEIISGLEEARLIYLGVHENLAPTADNRLVVDIGGGSTEVIVGRRRTPLEMESLYMGCVSTSLRYFEGGRIDRASWQRAELVALQELEPHVRRFRERGWGQAVGSSGTVRAVDRVVRAQGWSQTGITRESLDALQEALIEAGHADTLDFDGLSSERAPVFAGGVCVLRAVFESLQLERMDVANGALREGVLHDLLGRLKHEDPRHRTIEALMSRYHVDVEQAERVRATALRLKSAVEGQWTFQTSLAGEALGWAALTHEIGLDIAHAGFHRHGAYVVENGELPGFSIQEKQLLATLIRCHRRRFVEGHFEQLPTEWIPSARRLAVLLRLAVNLHRSRKTQPLPGFTFDADGDELTLRCPSSWLEGSPLTHADLLEEASYLEPAGFGLRVTTEYSAAQ